MARTREFDPEVAVDRAMQHFLENGYYQSSVRDLVKATGVAHAGLYTEFGDKSGLFLSALENYEKTWGDTTISPLEQKDANLKVIEHFFSWVLKEVKSGDLANGCLACNTSVEFGNGKEEILEKAQSITARIEKAMKNALKNAKKNKEVSSNININQSAAFLAATFYGVAVLARSKMPYEMCRNAVTHALSTLK